jgi:murein DD-endopeptidase MepM/ murein hydrolase activator NlpD
MYKKFQLPLALLVLLLAGVFSYIIYYRPTKTKQTDTTSEQPKQEETNVSFVFFPISKYTERLNYRKYGQDVTPADRPICGRAFSGIHDADDLEIFTGEENSDIPVYAVNDGTITFLNYVDGYGGLLIEQTNLDNQDVLLNYGHIKLDSARFKVGEKVKAGDQLAVLGKGCSTEADGERKHLHFAIHKGTTINMLGYLQTRNELSDWLNPSELLSKLNAKEK